MHCWSVSQTTGIEITVYYAWSNHSRLILFTYWTRSDVLEPGSIRIRFQPDRRNDPRRMTSPIGFLNCYLNEFPIWKQRDIGNHDYRMTTNKQTNKYKYTIWALCHRVHVSIHWCYIRGEMNDLTECFAYLMLRHRSLSIWKPIQVNHFSSEGYFKSRIIHFRRTRCSVGLFVSFTCEYLVARYFVKSAFDD